MDLNRSILEFMMNDEKRGTFHEIVSEVISFEAKRLL
jgi:hypothetical protein